ncbi:hypothetical protein [Lyngbya confervoides]|uniref:Uncharacterized protein n=1 Tax=Lyngbya confervoides BDU141951 TaxID=1574623 RepID=A0ABD4T6Y3_9CYAN|nr:hypothetical protein [Lyngbya confervoides]MCM1984010.1 hypothetical protein [Lyngbya confervoides BDU141951]
MVGDSFIQDSGLRRSLGLLLLGLLLGSKGYASYVRRQLDQGRGDR